MNIFNEDTFYIQEESLSFGEIALIGLAVAIVAYALCIAFQLAFVVPADVRAEVVNLIIK